MEPIKLEQSKITHPPCAEFHIVGIGASAGGLEALETLFRAIPRDSGLAYVVIQHLSPDFKSHMDELLSRHTSIPIRRVKNGLQVEPNTIYLIPSKMEMVISDGKLLITERSSDRAMIHPIDQFFRSLAADVGRYAIGVILSGTGSDGSRGIKDIHDAGGLVLAQDESTAKFDGMPMSATATGKVDLILSPAAIAEALVRYTKDGVTKDKLMEDDLAFSGLEGVDQIASLLNHKYGIDFSQYKPGTVGRRINRRLQLLGLDALSDYVERLAEDEQELSKLYEDLLIGVTKFFRDPEAFAALDQHAIENLLQDTKLTSIRIWVAACASGEEAYSIGMLVDEAMQRLDRRVDVKIFATDAHSGSLQKAARGFFAPQAVNDLSDERRQRYFRRNSDGYQVTRELRDYIVFAPHNIINDAPFTQMDLVTCRNMLIYLQPAAQKKALAMFHFALKPNGVLFLGPSESPGELSDEFKAIDQRWRLYTKRRDVRFPLGTIVPSGRRMERMPYATAAPQITTSNRVDRATIAMYDQLLSKKIGPSILVSERGEMLHIFGGAERFLKPRGGRPSNHLLEMIDDSLRSAVSIALHHATTKGESVRNVATHLDGRDSGENVTIVVEPLNDGGSEPNNILVSIETTRRKARSMTSDEISVNEMNRSRVEGLETELRYSQENLQAALEEMETSNEELQASNEELVASNEELQSTNEELHSVNEELYTVNAEHQRRVEELALANDDMDNLLDTTRVGVIFLDQDLYVRRFTPEIARVFRLTNQDTGRSIEHVAHVLNHPRLIDELRDVLKSQELKSHQELECKVTDRDGTPYLLRALPYRSGDTTEGLVLTLIDITSLAKAEAEIELQKMAIESAVNGIIITDPLDGQNPIRYANRGFLALTGYDADEVLGRDCRFLQCEESDPQAVDKVRRAVAKAEPVRVTMLNQRKDGTRFWNDLHITPMLDASGKPVHFVGVQHDVSKQIEAQNALQRANEAKSSFLATMSHELRTPLTAVLGFADMLRSESDDPAYLEKIDTIRRNGTYLLALLNDILDLSKVEAGKLRFGRESVDIRAVLKELEALMQVRAIESGVPLKFDLREPLPSAITADEVRVRQIIVNLVSNALKFADSGDVTVIAAMKMAASQPRLEISVIDTGLGISKKQQENLFTPFNQPTKRTHHHAGGTGLGLSICKRLAEGMGGSIEIESKLGEGSRFTLCLPVTKNQAANLLGDNLPAETIESTTNSTSLPTIDAKILVVDDRRDVWRIGQHFLLKCGARVTIAENGLQAIEEVENAEKSEDPFALVLMDMQMPVMDGRGAVTRLRELGFTLPIIALTADAMFGERESCLAIGCNEYFPKPIDGPRLMCLIASMLA